MFFNHDVVGQAHQVHALAVGQADHLEHAGEITTEPLLQTKQSYPDSHFSLLPSLKNWACARRYRRVHRSRNRHRGHLLIRALPGCDCRADLEQYCEKSVGITDGAGLGHDGGMAEYLLVPAARFLLPLHSLHPRDAAPLADAGLTPYHAIRRSLDLLKPGSTAVIIGAGGLGQMAIQIVKALTPARVIAVDSADQKLQAASRFGADQAVRSGDEAAKQIRDLTGGAGAEVVLEIVWADATLKLVAETRWYDARRWHAP